MLKSEILQLLKQQMNDEYIITPLGETSREWFHMHDRPQNFYMMGSMGMPISFGLGVALTTERNVIVVDGDGSLLMNMGGLSTIGQLLPPNLKILVLDNECYENTGCQTSATGAGTNLEQIARACGIPYTQTVYNVEQLQQQWHAWMEAALSLIVAKIQPDDTFTRTQTFPISYSPSEISRAFAHS